MTKEQARKLKTLIKKRVRAELNDSWSGAGDPADRPAIAHELVVAKMNLSSYIRELQLPTHNANITVVS